MVSCTYVPVSIRHVTQTCKSSLQSPMRLQWWQHSGKTSTKLSFASDPVIWFTLNGTSVPARIRTVRPLRPGTQTTRFPLSVTLPTRLEYVASLSQRASDAPCATGARPQPCLKFLTFGDPQLRWRNLPDSEVQDRSRASRPRQTNAAVSIATDADTER